MISNLKTKTFGLLFSALFFIGGALFLVACDKPKEGVPPTGGECPEGAVSTDAGCQCTDDDKELWTNASNEASCKDKCDPGEVRNTEGTCILERQGSGSGPQIGVVRTTRTAPMTGAVRVQEGTVFTTGCRCSGDGVWKTGTGSTSALAKTDAAKKCTTGTCEFNQ